MMGWYAIYDKGRITRHISKDTGELGSISGTLERIHGYDFHIKPCKPLSDGLAGKTVDTE